MEIQMSCKIGKSSWKVWPEKQIGNRPILTGYHLPGGQPVTTAACLAHTSTVALLLSVLFFLDKIIYY
jgi:hypothetical protein